MTATTANINFAIAWKGTSPANGLSFTFTAGSGLPAGVLLSSDGSLDFTKAYTKGQVIAIVFNLQTSSLTYGGSACPLSIYSQGGAPKSPVWVKNLQSNPDVTVQAMGKTMKLRARQVDDAEKARLWPICVQHYREFDDYQKRTDRNIPVFVCEPR